MRNEAAHLGAVYAQAIFELARRGDVVDGVGSDLDLLAGVGAASEGFDKFIASPFISNEDRKEIITRTFSGKLGDLTMDFLMVVIEHNRMMFLSEITAAYNRLWDVSRGCRQVRVAVSEKLSPHEAEKLLQQIESALKSKVNLEFAVDPLLIGGIVIRYDDKVVDNSIRGRLLSMVRTITKREQIHEV